MEYGTKEYQDIVTEFKVGRHWLNDVTVEIVGGENNLPALTLLRAYEAEPTIDNQLALTAQFVMNREIRFSRKGKVVHTCFYSGGDLSESFDKVPYLLDTLIKLSYGLMLKKLTPASEDSETEEMR